jgi:predicted neutral ceramidase superfamily lipid hydrolase
MFKRIAVLFGFSYLILLLTYLTSQIALAATQCTLNGQPISCAELGNKLKGFLGWGLGFGIAFFLVIFSLVIWSIVFWIMMIVHLSKNDVKDKVMWIILIIFTGIIGALIYYFVVKRKFINK